MAVAEFFSEQAKKLLDMASRCPQPKMAEAIRTTDYDAHDFTMKAIFRMGERR